MLRTYSLFLMIAILICACAKEEQPSATTSRGQLYAIAGTLFVQPGYDNTATLKMLAGQKVCIRIDTGSNKDTSNYFYSVMTGSMGGFTFYVSDLNVPYEIFTTTIYKSSPTYAPLYYGAIRTPIPLLPGNKLQLVARPDTVLQNGLDITSIDVAGNRAGRASVVIYTSPAIAASDADAFSGNGCLLRAATDSLGRAFISNLPQSDLYINARIISGKDTFQTVALPITVPKHKLINQTLTLIKK